MFHLAADHRHHLYCASTELFAAGCGTFFVPASSAAVCIMLRLENGPKNPQHVAVGADGFLSGDAAGQSLPYFSCSCGSTASTSAWSVFPAACALATASRSATR